MSEPLGARDDGYAAFLNALYLMIRYEEIVPMIATRDITGLERAGFPLDRLEAVQALDLDLFVRARQAARMPARSQIEFERNEHGAIAAVRYPFG